MIDSSGSGRRCPTNPPEPPQDNLYSYPGAANDGSSCSGSIRRNLGDGLSSNDDEDEDYDDVTVTAAEEDASVQIDVFGSPEVDDEAAAVSSLIPAPFSRTGRVRT